MVLQNAQINPQTGRVMSPLINIMEENGKKLNAAELFKQWVIKAGINDWDKIIIEEQADGSMGGEQGGVPIDQVEQELAEFEQQIAGGGQEQVQPQQPTGGIYA